jgi:Flp pilus assembly pilin Flp
VIGRLRRLWPNESGATIVEHAILVCVIALVVVTLVGSGLSPSMFMRSVAYVADSVLTGDSAARAIAVPAVSGK